MAAASRLEEEVERICGGTSITAEYVYQIYGLSAILEAPLMASTEACMLQLLRHCSCLRLECRSEVLIAYLDVLETLAGAYFGQDMELRKEYRDYGVHL